MFNRKNSLEERISQLGGTKGSQGHAVHFLERLRRADEGATRLALRLYHNPDALRYLLHWIKVPPNLSRVAISLSPSNDGPFIVTERDGKFVTCLAPEMGIDGLFLVTHDRLLALLARYSDIEQGIAHAKKLKDEDLLETCIRRLETAGMSYTREDLALIAPLQPLLVYDTYLEVVEGSRRVTAASQALSRKHIKKKIDDKTARLFWDAMFSVSHNLVLLGVNGTRGLEPILESAEHVEALWSALVATMWMNTFYHASRVIWLLGRLEGKLRRRYERALWHPEHEMDWLLGLLGTTVSMLRRKTDEESAVAMLKRLHRKIPNYASPVTNWLVTYLEEDFFRRLIFVLTDAETLRETYTIPEMQSPLYETLGVLPDSSPFHFDKPEEIPVTLALSGTMSMAGEFMNDPKRLAGLVPMLPVIIDAEASDIYPPKSLAALLTPPWDRECTQIILDRETEMWKTPAAKTAKSVGRNAPCPCGSGKKYKKCCYNKTKNT